MMKHLWIFLLLLPLSGFAKQPVGFKKWQHDDTTFSKQIGGAIRNYPRPDLTWDSIHNYFDISGDSLAYVDKCVLKTTVIKDGGSSITVWWNGEPYIVTQKMLGIGWIKISTRQSQWIDSTMYWDNFSVDSNICKWTGVSPGVDYRVRKSNGQVEHGIFYKPAFVDSAVILYNQRPDSLDIALANVMIYTLSANIDNHDSAMGDLFWRGLKDFGYYSFNLSEQRLRFPGSDTLPQIPVKQYWERRGTKIICIEYVMMRWVKQVHEAYPSATIWHNDTKKIEGTTNVEDARMYKFQADNNFGGTNTIQTYSILDAHSINSAIRVKNVASELGVGATITGAVCSLYCVQNATDGTVSVYRIFKPWEEGTREGVACQSPGCSWNDWACTDKEWTTEGCLCADDDGVDNSYDGGVCNQSIRRDRKETAESSIGVATVNTWYGWSITAALAQDWYDGTANENGVLLHDTDAGNNTFHSTEAGESEKPYWVFTYTTGAPEAAGQVIMIQQ